MGLVYLVMCVAAPAKASMLFAGSMDLNAGAWIDAVASARDLIDKTIEACPT